MALICLPLYYIAVLLAARDNSDYYARYFALISAMLRRPPPRLCYASFIHA